LVEGSGLKRPLVDTPCDCHYLGTLIDGTQFDSSFDRGKPSTFAPNQVIKGWTEAMQLMVEGDKWEMYIPYHLAYGEHGKPPKIPAKATLIFIMELVKIKGTSAPVDDFPDWSPDDLKLWTSKDQSACDEWTAKKVKAFEASDAKLTARFADRAALDDWTSTQSQKTKNQALWKRTRAARRKAKAAQFNSQKVEDSNVTPPPAPSPAKMDPKTARAILDAAFAQFKANKDSLTKTIQAIEDAPGDASSKQMQKMMQLLPKVQQLMAPALTEHGFRADELMSVVMRIQACAADDPTIAADTTKLMKAAQGDISGLV
jgi:FKBP-type peptidyl-prolyl cis-trans isomerase FklB